MSCGSLTSRVDEIIAIFHFRMMGQTAVWMSRAVPSYFHSLSIPPFSGIAVIVIDEFALFFFVVTEELPAIVEFALQSARFHFSDARCQCEQTNRNSVWGLDLSGESLSNTICERSEVIWEVARNVGQQKQQRQLINSRLIISG
jgi:hypothetical protein